MGIFSALIPSDKKFFGLFEKVAENLRAAADRLGEYASCESPDERKRLAQAINDLEHVNDVCTHEIFTELHGSFIIPFDREDIHALAASLDDILDYATYTVMRVEVYHIDELTEVMRRQLSLLSEAIRSVCDIVERLRSLKNIAEIAPYLQEVHRIENEGDNAHTAALEELFSEGADPVFILKWKDIHHLAETAMDRCERAADVAEGIAIKHA